MIDINKFGISPINDALRQLFFVTSDYELEAYVMLYFNFDTSSNESLKVLNKDLYDTIVSKEFLNDFKDDFINVKIELFFKLFEEEKSKKRYLECFRKLYVDYLKNLSLNRSTKKITFSDPYVKEINKLLKDLDVRLSNRANNDNMKLVRQNNRFKKDHFTLSDKVSFDARQLREFLIVKNLINGSEVKMTTLENLFSESKSKSKVNWIGGKTKLYCFLKELKVKEKITDKFIHKIASKAFLIDGKEFEKLSKPNNNDMKNYSKEIEKMVLNHFPNKSPKNK